MRKASAESKAVQGESELPRFKVELVDASGQVRDRIGYWFYEPGALTAANGWNKLSAEERNGLTARIDAFDAGVTEAMENPKLEKKLAAIKPKLKKQKSKPAGNIFDRVVAESLASKAMCAELDKDLDEVKLSRNFVGWAMDLHELVKRGWRPVDVEDVSRLCFWLRAIATRAHTGTGFEFAWETGQDTGTATSFHIDDIFSEIDETPGVEVDSSEVPA